MAPEEEKFMRAALAEARRAYSLGSTHRCCAGQGCAIIGRGHNLREGGRSTAHAEMLALRRAAAALGTWRLAGTTMYVTIEPCPMCAGALVLARWSIWFMVP